MAPPTPKPALTVLERMKLIQDSPNVKVYVGPHKVLRVLPKNLLCAASPYFDRCFNGGFIEGQTQELFLEEDKVEYFDVLIEYMYQGSVRPNDSIITVDMNNKHTNLRWQDNPARWTSRKMQEFKDFVMYADKYDLKGASEGILKSLERFLACHTMNGRDFYHSPKQERITYVQGFIRGEDIEFFFENFPAGSPFRQLIAKTVIAHWGPDELDRFEKQEIKVDGYAVEMLRQFRACNWEPENWRDPLTNEKRGANLSRSCIWDKSY